MIPSSEAQIADPLTALADGRNRDPFAVLGPHPDPSGRGTLVRAFHPAARSIDLRLRATGELRPMTKRTAGLFEIVVSDQEDRFDYRLRMTFPANHVLEVDDPYRYGRVLTDFDLHLFGEGR